MKPQVQVGFFLIIATAAFVVGGNYLAEKPDVLTPCKQSDSGFNQCFANNFQAIFSAWKDGVPGLKSVGSIDPLYVKRIAIAEDGNNPVSINVDLHGIQLTGLSQTLVDDASFNPDKWVTKLYMTMPKLTINSDYNIKGRILTLPLNGSGKAFMAIENLKLEILFRLKARDEGGFTFTDIDKLRVDIKNVGGFKIRLDNLFNGQQALEETANALFNDSWRELYETLRPSITATVQSVMTDRMSKIFSYVPATYFIEDLASGN